MNGEFKDLNPKFNHTFSEVLKNITIVWQGNIVDNLEAGINFVEIETADGTIELF